MGIHPAPFSRPKVPRDIGEGSRRPCHAVCVRVVEGWVLMTGAANGGHWRFGPCIVGAFPPTRSGPEGRNSSQLLDKFGLKVFEGKYFLRMSVILRKHEF